MVLPYILRRGCWYDVVFLGFHCVWLGEIDVLYQRYKGAAF